MSSHSCLKITVRLIVLLAVALLLTNTLADLKVASLSTITCDLAGWIGGTNVTVSGIINPGIDPHEFEPTPGDVKKCVHADLVLFMEDFMTKLEDAAGGRVNCLR